jgi:opacity protein-like surface antigen
MKKLLAGVAVLALASFGAASAAAQGPAGAGADVAAGGGSAGHSYNPVKWFGKKDGKSASESSAGAEELDKKLETRLRAAQVLPEDGKLKDACENFTARVDCLAALHASKGLGLRFDCLKSNLTGVRIGTDPSSCRIPDNDKPLSLSRAIHLLKPDADSKGAAKEAEAIARQELKDAAGS